MNLIFLKDLYNIKYIYKYMTCGIYCIKNIKTKKKYIGQSINIEKRKSKHFSLLRHNNHDNQHLQNSFNKYGEKNFIFKIICELENNTILLNEMEQYYIFKYNTYHNGYNLTIGGDFCPMKDPEIAKKVSGEKNGMYGVRLCGKDNPQYGKKLSDEHKKKISKRMQGENNPKWKYTLWDVSKCYYSRYDMFKNGNKNGLNFRKCFMFKYKTKKIKIGAFIDFYTPELLYKLTEKFLIC